MQLGAGRVLMNLKKKQQQNKGRLLWSNILLEHGLNMIQRNDNLRMC